MKRIPILILAILGILGFLISCSTRYTMTKEYKHTSGKKQLVNLDNVWLKIFLHPHSSDAKSFEVSFVLKDVTTGKHPTLSKVKADLIDPQKGDTATTTTPVSFRTLKMLTKDADRERVKEQFPDKVELAENCIYSFDYLFEFQHADQPVKKLQLHLQAELNIDGRIVAIDKTFPFSEIRYLNIAGN